MSRPETRSQSKKNRTEQEPLLSPDQATDPLPITQLNASTVNHNNSEHNTVRSNKSSHNDSENNAGTVRSNKSNIRLRKKEAELAAAKRMIELEKIIVEKELQVELARLSVHESRASTSSKTSRSRVQEWLTSELHKNEQQERFEHPTSISGDHIQTSEPKSNAAMRTESTELTDIQLLAQEISKLRRPTEGKELPYYNGSVQEWLSFKAAFTEVSASLTSSDLISRLRRCLKGEARETVAALLHSEVPASEIMEALEIRFGRPELILFEEVKVLKDLPKLSDSTEQLSKFACKVRNRVATIKALNKPEHLHNIELVQTLKLKMPHLKSRWISYAIEHEHDDEPELVKLSNFLKKEAQSVSKYWTHEPLRPPMKPAYYPHRTHYTEIEEFEQDTEPCYASNFNQQKSIAERTCPYCKSTIHTYLKDCDKFMAMTIDDRWKWANDAKVCFKCMKPRHRRETCRAGSCGIDGCRMSHSRLLHSPTNTQPGTSAAVTDPAAAPEPLTQKPEPVNTTSAGSRTTPRTQVLLKIIPVEIRGPVASKRTYALLDGGSSLTLMKQKLAVDIGLKGKTEPLTIAGVNATSEEPNSQRVDLEIVGPSNTPVDFVGHTDQETHEMVENYFKIDSLGISNNKNETKEEEKAINILKNTTRRIEDGNKEVLPEKLRYSAKTLQSAKRKMDRDPAYGLKYKNMDSSLRSKYARPCDPVQSPKKWYLPHFGVSNVKKPGKFKN